MANLRVGVDVGQALAVRLHDGSYGHTACPAGWEGSPSDETHWRATNVRKQRLNSLRDQRCEVIRRWVLGARQHLCARGTLVRAFTIIDSRAFSSGVVLDADRTAEMLMASCVVEAAPVRPRAVVGIGAPGVCL